MKCAAVLLLMSLGVLSPAIALAQAHGPTAQEVQENGQDIPSGRERRQQALAERMQLAGSEQQVPLDAATRTARLAELETWFRRLPSRFRIEGTLEMLYRPNVIRKRDIDGVADCQEIGEGSGLHCILNARWHNLIEDPLPIAAMLANPSMKKFPSEQLNTLQPAVLVLGLDLDGPGIRAMMVDVESFSHMWTGPLHESTARASRLNRCLPGKCLQSMEIVAEAGSQDIEIILHSGLYTIRLNMARDPDARAEQPIKGVKTH